MDQPTAAMPLTPIKGGAACSVHFEEDVISLRADDGRVLLMLPREEASAHIRFDWRLPHGPVISFVIIEGLRAYTFRGSRDATRALLRWLPLRTTEALAQEMRWHGTGVVLLGTAMLLFPHAQLWPYAGVAAVLAGCLSVLRPVRGQYGVNAVLFMVLGLLLLFATPWMLPPQMPLFWPTLFGALLVLWGIQQTSLLSPQHLLEQSRVTTTGARRLLQRGSRVPAIMSTITLGCSIPLWALAWQSRADVTLLVSYAALAVVTLGIAATIILRGRHSFRELLLGGQWAVVLLYFLTAGLIWHSTVYPNDPTPYPLGPVLGFHSPYVFLPLLALVLLFNVVLRQVIRARLATDEEE